MYDDYKGEDCVRMYNDYKGEDCVRAFFRDGLNLRFSLRNLGFFKKITSFIPKIGIVHEFQKLNLSNFDQ